MDLPRKIRTLPTQAGVYLVKNAEGEGDLRGKAKALEHGCGRIRRGVALGTQKPAPVWREAVDVESIVWTTKRALRLKTIDQQKSPASHPVADDKITPTSSFLLAERFPAGLTSAATKEGGQPYTARFSQPIWRTACDLIHRFVPCTFVLDRS